MNSLTDLDKKQVAVCYTYGDTGNLFIHCIGVAKFVADQLVIERSDEEAYFVSDEWNVKSIELKDEQKSDFSGSDYLLIINVVGFYELEEQTITLILVLPDQSEKIMKGIFNIIGNSLCIKLENSDRPFEIYRDWLPKIAPVSEKVESIDSNYLLRLSVGNIDDEVDTEDYLNTGINLRNL